MAWDRHDFSWARAALGAVGKSTVCDMDGGNVNGGISYFGGAHPSVNFMHVATKAAPAIVYIVCTKWIRYTRAQSLFVPANRSNILSNIFGTHIGELINNGAFVTNFVIIVVLLGVDFWTVRLSESEPVFCPLDRIVCISEADHMCYTFQVKNICGRLLVGLRWWNENDEEGNTTWRFETLNPNVRRFAIQIITFSAVLSWQLSSLRPEIEFALRWLM